MEKLYVHAIQVLLGLLWNTQDMTVVITPDYRVETIHLLRSTWHHGRNTFTISELEKMVGKLGCIGQGYQPIYHLMPMLYASAAFGLRENDEFLHSTSKAYSKLIKLAKSKPKTLRIHVKSRLQ